MFKKHNTFRWLSILLLLLCFCGIIIGLFWSIINTPKWAQAEFGQPSPALTSVQKIQYSFQMFIQRPDLVNSINPDGFPQKFQIRKGESVNSIAFRLETAGLIRDAGAFRVFLIYSGLDIRLQAGEYQISPANNAMQIAQMLVDATPKEIDFPVLPGWRLEEIAAVLPTSGLSFDPEQFLTLAKNAKNFDLPARMQGLKSLEGFIFPENYRFNRNIQLQEFLKAILARFDEKVSSELEQTFKKNGLTLIQAVTLASMVQREAVVSEEQPMIASVFLNRLAIGMKLDSDPTVQYSLASRNGQPPWWKSPLSIEDLKIASTYNTYLQAGLPPGPICNPSLSALQAVAYPGQSPYLYFRARCDGSGRHAFAKTFEEHLRNVCP